MVADLIFGTIQGLTIYSTFSSYDLVITVASYLNFDRRKTKEEASVAAKDICAAVICVEYLTVFEFRNRKGVPVSFDSDDPCSCNITYFAFRSVFRISTIDNRAPVTRYFVDFVL